MENIKGIIFDMDGTMVDNMMIHHRAWQRKLASLGLELSIEEVHQRIHGVNEEIIGRLFGDRFSPEERRKISAEKEAEYRSIFLPELKLLDGLSGFLDEMAAANIPMAVGSAAPAENIDFVLDNLNLRQYFKTVMHAGHVKNGKPHPEIFENVSAALGIPARHCLVFEDSPTGVTAAMNAGCPAIVVTTTHEKAEFQSFSNVVGFINDFTEVSLESILATA